MNKAQEVEQAYVEASWFWNSNSECCYRDAVYTAHELGGIEIANSNDGNTAHELGGIEIANAPTRTFEFDDSSTVYVTYGGAFVIAK